MFAFSFVESPHCEEEAAVPLEEWTAEELYEGITGILEIHEEILEYVAELKAVFSEDGEITSLAYKIGEVFKDIKELDKETLLKIYHRIASERIRVMTEKRARQLEVIRMIDRIRPPEAPSAPKIPAATPPGPPKLPQLPPEVPSVPEQR